MKQRYLELLQGFSGKKILVIGDIMLDNYIYGSINRISPEAPIDIVDVQKEVNILGGAANTANNVKQLGGDVVLIGTVGSDGDGKIILDKLSEEDIANDIISDKDKPTIRKTRVMAKNKQILRIDLEKKDDVHEKIENKLFESVKNNLPADIILISDYMKGTITKNFADKIIGYAKQEDIKVLVDPKSRDFYHDVYLMTPNHKELCEMFGVEVSNGDGVLTLGKRLVEKTRSNVLVTRGKKGATLFMVGGGIKNIPTKAKDIYDVSGAGDTVIATIAMALAAGAELNEAAVLANHAAGIVVGKVGTATATIEEVRQSFEDEVENGERKQ